MKIAGGKLYFFEYVIRETYLRDIECSDLDKSDKTEFYCRRFSVFSGFCLQSSTASTNIRS